MSPPTSPQPNPSADTRSPVRPSSRYSMADSYTTSEGGRAAPPVACPRRAPWVLSPHASRPPRPHRTRRLPPLPRHHDLRPAVRRGRLPRHPRSRGGGRHHLSRHRGRLPGGRRIRDGGAHRGDRGALARRPAPRLRGGHQVRRGDERAALGPRRVAQAHPGRHRRLPAPASHRLRGSLPAPSPGLGDADRREPARARRRGPGGQGPLRGLLELPRLPGGAGPRAQRAARGRALRLGAAALQPALPPGRARPLAALPGGLLSGKHRRDSAPTPGTRFTLGNAAERYQDRYWHEREFETVEALRPLAAEAGMSLARLAVAWMLAEPAITSPIVGASRPDQLDDVLPATEKPLDAALKARLDEMTREYRWGDDPR